MLSTKSKIDRYFGSLAGKFTLSQALTTLLVTVVIASIFQVIAYVSGVSNYQKDLKHLSQSLDRYAQRISGEAKDNTGLNLSLDFEYTDQPYIDQAIDDVADAFAFLGEIRSVDGSTVFMLTDGDGKVLESSRPEVYAEDYMLLDKLNEEQLTIFSRVQSGESDLTQIELAKFNIFREAFVATPILTADKQVKAMIVVRTHLTLKAFVLDFLDTLGWLFLNFVLIAIPLIVFLSRRQGKRVADRLDHLAAAAKQWAKGDLSTFIEDDKKDEIGDFGSDLNAMAKEFQTLLESKEELAVIKERNRLAIELHDSVKQQVFAIGLKIALLESSVGSSLENVSNKKHLEQMQAMVQNVKQELNRLIHELKPSELEHSDFLTALQEYVSRWSESHGILVDVSCKGDQVLLPELEQSFFRVTQEALANILKHSQASQVEIEVNLQEDFKLRIEDNGQGFNKEQLDSKGIGLRVMKERIEKLGGEFQLSSFPNQGTTIEVFCSP